MKSFEKILQKFTAAKPQNLDRKKQNKSTDRISGFLNLKEKNSGNRIMIFLLLQCPSSLYVIRKILHYFLDKTDISRHFSVALWWDYNKKQKTKKLCQIVMCRWDKMDHTLKKIRTTSWKISYYYYYYNSTTTTKKSTKLLL